MYFSTPFCSSIVEGKSKEQKIGGDFCGNEVSEDRVFENL